VRVLWSAYFESFEPATGYHVIGPDEQAFSSQPGAGGRVTGVEYGAGSERANVRSIEQGIRVSGTGPSRWSDREIAIDLMVEIVVDY
jgi:hypothetical protein